MTEFRNAPLTDAEGEVLRLVRSIKFGSVEIILHDSRIVEIVRKEKLRPEADRTTGGSQRRSG